MKKYWKTVIAVIVIVTGIGTYYMQSFISALSLPDFEIKTIEGDDKFIDHLVLVGNYQREDEKKDDQERYYDYNNGEYLYITKDETIYRDSVSFLNQIKGIPNTRDRVLRDKYGDFFRGVNYWGNTVYEDDEYLVAVDFNYSRNYGRYEALKVKYLNKETGQSHTITENLKVNEHLMFEDVQMNDEEIIVFTKTWKFNDENFVHNEVIRAYRFNINDKKLVSVDELFVEENDLNYNIEVSFLVDSKSWSPNEYVVVRKRGSMNQVEEVVDEVAEENDSKQDKEERVIEEGLNVLYAYHVATNEVKQINLPETVNQYFINNLDGSNLYFVNDEPNGLVITVYSIHEEKIINEINIDYVKYSNNHGDHFVPIIRIDNGYIYVHEKYATNKENASLRVFDAETGNMVYKGEIVSNSKEDFEIELYHMEFNN